MLVIAASATFLMLNDVSDQVKYRSGNKTESKIMMLPTGGATLHKNDLNFKWSPVPGSIAYRFILYEESGFMINVRGEWYSSCSSDCNTFFSCFAAEWINQAR